MKYPEAQRLVGAMCEVLQPSKHLILTFLFKDPCPSLRDHLGSVSFPVLPGYYWDQRDSSLKVLN